MPFKNQPEIIIKEIQFDGYDKDYVRKNPSIWFGILVKAYTDTHKEELKDDKIFFEKIDLLKKKAFDMSYDAFNRPEEVMQLLREEIKFEDRTPQWKKKLQENRDAEREVALDEQEGFDPSITEGV